MPGEHITQEQADEFAIGSFEPALERAIALHLAECSACRDIVRDSERLAATFALGMPIHRPPARLKRKVLSAAGIQRPSAMGRAIGWGRAAAGAAAVVVAIAAFTGMVWVRGELNELRHQNTGLQTQIDDALSQKVALAAITQKLDDQERAAAKLEEQARGDQDLLVAMLSPETRIAEVVATDDSAGTIGRLVWDNAQKRVWFVASDLPRRPDNETYELWVSNGGKYYSIGAFRPDETGFARYQAIVPEGISNYETAVVTIEQQYGSPNREGPTVFFVTDLSRLKN